MKYALVTSSTKGIGKAIGLELMSKGYYVFFNYYHDDNAAIKLSNELLLLNNFHNRDNYAIIKSDMTTYEGIEIIYKSIVQITNQLDCKI
jgi:NAD(P)-dependent dehydrogenase (short-subunit alcohol dehydrogenase family)